MLVRRSILNRSSQLASSSSSACLRLRLPSPRVARRSSERLDSPRLPHKAVLYFQRSNMSTLRWTPPSPGDVPAPPVVPANDLHSHANLLEIKPKHIDIDWTVDWKHRVISGKVTHTVQVSKDGVDSFILDTSYLDVTRVRVNKADAKWSVGKRKGTLGSPLTIELGVQSKGAELEVEIDYSTTKECTALGWLTAEQTESKKTPFLYSQAQAIHGRSMLPCVDSPCHKITYTAKVKSEVPVLMSALAEGSVRATDRTPGEAFVKEEGVYRFRQPVGIPTYLIAIVGGTLEFRALAPRVGVWAEPTMIDRAEWEFKHDANKFLEAAEETISPYSWTRYDCVVLPPSFPYGGMENANLTTLTPALICGDRSQTDVLLHELAHSWSGNLTSCGNWSSFWLNEGINVWIERLLLQVVHGAEAGPAYRGFSYIIGAKALRDALEQFESVKRFQRLVPVFHDGEDPDDAFSSIPYEKGSNFILHLERTVGGLDVFLPFIQSHFRTFYDRSLTTEEWQQHLFDFYAGSAEITAKLKAVDWHGWLHGEGLELPVKMEYDNTLAVQAQKLADRWIRLVEGKTSVDQENFGPNDIVGWDSNQVVVFLEALHSGPKLSAALAEQLDKTYKFSNQVNSEIRLRFYEVALEDAKTAFKKEAAEWVAKQGRMKYCRVLYRALNKVDPELARSTFIENRSFYHPIAAAMIANDLSLLPSPGAERKKRKRMVMAVCGSTGTGKSQLAVELAKHFGECEIISADSMQIYHGLDAITNKVTEEEMQGIPHHLISFLDPERDQVYDVGSFIRDATQVMDELEEKGMMPIVAGGTTYYLQHLLLPGRLVSAPKKQADVQERDKELRMKAEQVEEIAQRASSETLDAEQLALLLRLVNAPYGSTNLGGCDPLEVWKLLHLLDETMANRWHYRDFRKVLRSIRILFETGKRHSEIIAEQQQQQQQQQVQAQETPDEGSADDDTSVLIFHVECKRDILNKRLDGRVDKMIDNGLLREIVELRTIARRSDRPTDYTRGIFQAIGYKEFDKYLQHIEDKEASDGAVSSNKLAHSMRPDVEDRVAVKLFDQAVEEMKIATRQFAKSQVAWVRNQLKPSVLANSQSKKQVFFASLDASDLTRWTTDVHDRAIDLSTRFLNDELPTPGILDSDESSSSNADVEQVGSGGQKDKSFRVCPECTFDAEKPHMIIASRWEMHRKGKSHRQSLRVRRGKKEPLTGPEVEAKRKEREQRRHPSMTTTTSTSFTDGEE